MVLIFLGALRSEFSKTRQNVINSSTLKSLEDTYYLLCEVVKSQNQATKETQDRSTLAVQD